ncbi:MAG TPA: response regulator transcription factor [Dehalococcoidia bacterium]|nr:response regulator transcription factor [Dehalococcoidia bacterium]
MKILVVEDEHRLADLLRRALEHERHTVEISYDGEDGLRRSSTGMFDLVVLDVMLPKLDGFEVCRRLRGAGVSTPVLMLTARDAVADRVQGLDAGADDYLTKPFAVAELLARVRALGRRGPAAPEILQVCDVILDPARHSVRRAHRHIDLTRTEFALLEYLMRHPGQVLTRQQIMDHVWGYDYETMTNVVDIYVHYLRNKLEKGFKGKLIRTVRGVGYSIIDGE